MARLDRRDQQTRQGTVSWSQKMINKHTKPQSTQPPRTR